MSASFWDWFNNEIKPLLKFDINGGLHPIQRGETFTKIFEYLDALNRPVGIIETGCMRNNDNWGGDGKSTVLFDRYVNENGGTFYSVDIDPVAIQLCREAVSEKTKLYTGDSIEYLKTLATSPPDDLKHIGLDLLYLDSFDFDPRRPLISEVHHINEFYAILPLIRPNTLVVVDDSTAVLSDNNIIDIAGKGRLIARYAIEVGAVIKFSGWQTGWIGINKPPEIKLVKELDDRLKVLISRARTHFTDGEYIQAGMLYQQILLLTDPLTTGVTRIANGEACVFFARNAYANERMGAALDWYRRALQADPLAVDYRLELASKVWRRLRFWEAGRKESEIATRIEPNNIHAWGILGSFEHDMNNVGDATFCYDKELEIDPDDSGALLDRISMALDTADYDTAVKLCDRISKTDRAGDGLHCLGLIAYREARHEDAIKLYDEALAYENVTNRPTVHWNKSLALHAIGRYKEGWHEHKWRKNEITQPALSMPLLRFKLPGWNKEPPPATIHVHMEAGAGDNICCSRYLNVLIQHGYRVHYESYPDMLELMVRSFPDVKVMPQAADYPGAIGIPNFDYHVPIGELPHLLGTDIDTVPNQVPYIKPDTLLVEKYRKLLPSNKKKIGICWSSGIRLDSSWIIEYGTRKSMRFNPLRPLFEVPGCFFTSLQVGPERAENKGIISDFLPERPKWDDTAALVENLDLVISVDTAVMHLAGAMNKPVWVMGQRDGASWHLMCYREGASWNETSPWYPSLRVFRQHEFNRPHYWDDVVKDIVKELEQSV